ncbi:hypothetical protein GVN21_09055 [Caulobacter sp. SLTY]|uniref:hypothetical protein n=1 Tax=Caulobacter sp. SLTY TaxID=2683262 RepID=UPI0014128B95|nr:hypothetical protein [Caulobacter sp. SLTY]NBB15502.1 hypothetical protein [Caulobacter sp. SLTY]
MLLLGLVVFLMIFSGATAGEWWEVAAAALCVSVLTLLLSLITGQGMERAIGSFTVTFILALGVGLVTYLINKVAGRSSAKRGGRKDFFGRKRDSKADVFD